MSYTIKYDPQTKIVYTCQQDTATLNDRIQIINDLASMNLPSESCVLSDIRGLKGLISGAESQLLRQQLTDAGLSFRKVAVVHSDDVSPYAIFSTEVFLKGSCIEEFSSKEAAEAWLKQ